MHLDKLSIRGFKSFAEGVELLFDGGITAIVGPNGCGKSNVADAIRWALGEQSAKSLRCEKMEDIIFNGGSQLEPSRLAEVALRIGDSDGVLPLESPDVEIKRQLDRLGDSRYYLNEDNCLRRNISELFMDTGIGVNAYSLMEQNKVDMILDTHQRSRRFLFDEVAGITKYKHRKKEALKKLQETEGNLIRINDVIHELERETLALKEQAARAELYLQRQSELKSLEVELNWRQYHRFTQRLNTIQADLDEVQQGIEETTKAIEETETEGETKRREREELQGAISEAQAQVRKLESDIERTESNIALLKERQLSSQERRKRALGEIEALEKQNDELNEQKEQAEQEREGLANAIKLDENKLIAQERVLQGLSERISAASEHIEKWQTELINVMNSSSKIQSELSTISNNLEHSTDKLNNLSENTNRSQEELTIVDAALANAQKQNDELEADTTGIANQQRETEAAIRSAQQELRRLEAEMKELQDELGVKVSRLKSLEELQRDYEGYYTGVRAILKASEFEPERFGGICGVIAEIIKTSPDYEIAIEVALGSGIQNVITESAEDAKTAIEFLKRAKAGRVTFLPLDILRARRYSGGENLLQQPGTIGIASELVYFDPQYTVAIEHLLGNTLLVEDMDTAIRISRLERGGGARLVTLDGELINTSGAITGGVSKTQTGGLLRRAREIDELHVEVASHSKTLQSKEKKRRNTNEKLTELQQKGQNLSSSLQEKQIQLAHIRKDLEGYKKQRERLTQELADTQNEEKSVKMEVGKLEAKKADLKSQLEALEKSRNALARRIERLTEQNSSEKRKLDEVAKLHTDLKIELAGKRQRVQNIETALKTVEGNQAQIEQNIRERQKSIKSDDKIREELNAQIAAEQDKFLSLEGDKFQATEKVEELTSQREGLLNQIAAAEKELRSLRRKLNKYNQDKHGLEVAKTQVKMEMNAIASRVLDKYNISVDEIQKNDEIQEEDDQLAMLIDELKARIADMGSVNLMAIEDYKGHQERRQFLCEQRDDLEKSLHSTYKAIQKINETSRERFLATFELIKTNFQEVFAQLFGGGETDLLLTRNGDRKRKPEEQDTDDELSALVEEAIGYEENPSPAEDDILECGIDIIARPPGKRPQSIAALSGGERALVAIALLFAIFKIKPSPFCVLDEVDAALDDANVLRFTNLIRAFSQDTQFIIITHNKRTMEIADIMYGVTMEKAGVSKLVSMKLNK